MDRVFSVERAERKKVIPGYGGRYEVSDLGRVYSEGFELGLINGRFVKLCHRGRVDRVDVSYLVARAFLPNSQGRPYVVHKDLDRTNNRVENLEWSEEQQVKRLITRSDKRAVVQYDLEGNCIGRFESLREASEKTGLARNLIKNCADGRSRRAKIWVFRYI